MNNSCAGEAVDKWLAPGSGSSRGANTYSTVTDAMLLLQLVPTDVMPRLVILGERQVETETDTLYCLYDS
jgi:hypothetical protein